MAQFSGSRSVSLSTLGEGALEEKFQIELQKVLDNIADPNTKEGAREIALKIVFAPNTQRSAVAITISASSKLQGDLAYESHALLGKEGAQLKIWEHNPEQLKLPVSEGAIRPAGKVIGGL